MRYARADLRLFRRRQTADEVKPLLVTIKAPGDQFHTWAMKPGDGVGMGEIRVDIGQQGEVIVSPDKAA